MAGHSKWANIVRRKNAQDAVRGKLFTKLIREIIVSVKTTGITDPNFNPRLRSAIDKAYAANMTKQTIEKAISKGSDKQDLSNYESIEYEAYGPSGSAIIIECLTDNKNRTAGEVRHIITKFGGKLGISGSVKHLFNRNGCINFNITLENYFDSSSDFLLNLNIEDLDTDKENLKFNILTEADKLHSTCAEIKNYYANINEKLLVNLKYELAYLAHEYIQLSKDDVENLEKLLSHLDDLDDVQNIYHNVNMQDFA